MGVRRMRHDVVGLFGRGRIEHAGKHRQRPQRALLRTGEQVMPHLFRNAVRSLGRQLHLEQGAHVGHVVPCCEPGVRDGAPLHQRRLIIRFHSCGGACRRRLVLDEEQLGTAHLRAWPGECGRGPIGVEGQPKLVAHKLQIAELLGG